MGTAQHYWVCTVAPDGCPHATPVDGLWLDDQLYFGGSPTTRRQRNLAENPRVCVHLESGTDVVILHGSVQALLNPDSTLSRRLADAASRKYGYAVKPEDYAGAGLSVFQPHTVFAWRNFPTDATRWSVAPDPS
ncbi:MAG TPA: pyridoxamine 5'-phosphate oxidase family protein [Herpetosiphonaceae bacterium]